VNTKDISEARDPLLSASVAAMKRAGEQARQRAVTTRTRLVVWRDGQIRHIDPSVFERASTGAMGTTDASTRMDQLARAIEDGFVKEPAVVTQRDFDPKRHTPEEIEKIKLEDGIRLHEAAKVERLLAVESAEEPTEIVIHVNMLKEGWDVTNLYTIVPLRAANARTLIEQSIGRGLRLPFGRRTGVPAVDRLNIVAHDRFQEIIDEANRGDSPIRLKQVVLDAPSETEPTISVRVGSNAETALGLSEAKVTGGDGQQYAMETESLKTPAFSTEREKQAARAVMDVIGELERGSDAVPNSAALTKPDVQQTITEQVRARLTPQQGELLPDDGLDLDAVVAKTTETVARGMIDIPRIAVVPTGEVTVGFRPFKLDLSGLSLQPADRELMIHHLQSNDRHTLASEAGITERRLEDYLVFSLLDYDDIDYEAHAELLYDLAGQMVRHLLEYLAAPGFRPVRRVEVPIADNIAFPVMLMALDLNDS